MNSQRKKLGIIENQSLKSARSQESKVKKEVLEGTGEP